ncbi:AAA-like domain-containing protein [Pseudanabaena sp. FACHB-1998]|uniref:AAA-like domain-containing protein n=1 Tax=Pseudanabaena sp. FACHB-1998 TaxID=2692858 RepID=UPI0016808712|nr:AAA-like domain-containing protein [Pseudanabaena sp. FACHB-1998]MBD2178860.1 AAA-like domain-containing protein [Pseudanabaena sp. FACHB-1998]
MEKVIPTTLAGHYQVIEHLGSGGFGQTFLAKDVHLPGSGLCVVKQFKPIANDPETLQIAKRLFDREAETLYHLGDRTDQIPRLMAHFEQDGEFYLVQEYIEGQALDKEIASSKRLNETEVIKLLQDVLQVLAFVHQQNVIHRDIKPANLIRRSSDRKFVLIDFGAVKRVSEKSVNSLGQTSTLTVAIGSQGYMPSEQMAGQPNFSSDIYGVGMLCFQALTGLSPKQFLKDNYTGEYTWALCRKQIVDNQVALDIRDGLAVILERMVRYDYRQRYKDATVALQALAEFLEQNSDDEATVIHGNPFISEANAPQELCLESPEGQVNITSPFYVFSPYEQRCYEEIDKSGSLLRIKSPQRMGKSSLMIRILDQAKQQGYRTVALNLDQASQKLFSDLDKFMQWFCASVGKQLGVKVKLEDYWDDIFGANDNSTDYFEKYLLMESEPPLVLALDNFDRIFKYPDVEVDFCGLLRGWYESSRIKPLWSKLRLIIVHSQESYAQKDINQSPFNVGLPIELGEFTLIQVQSLVGKHGLDWTEFEIIQLMNLIGGHPYLVRSALYHIASGDISLEQFIKTSPSEAGIYSSHLLGLLRILEEHADLSKAMQMVVNSEVPVRLRAEEAFKLDSMGLVVRIDNNVTSRCSLYRQYFCDRLGST